MRRRVGFLLIPALLLVRSGAANSNATTVVHDAADSYWRLVLDEYPEVKISRGMEVEALPDPSVAHASALALRARSLLAPLAGVDAARLEPENAITLGILRIQLGRIVEAPEFANFDNPVTPYGGGMRGVEQIFSEHPFRNSEDAARYLALLDQYPLFLRRVEDRLRRSAAAGIVAPKAEIAICVPFLETFDAAGDGSPFAVSAGRLAALPTSSASALRRQVDARIRERIHPAFRRLLDYVKGEYAARAPAAVGLGQYPGGAACYRRLIRVQTGLDLSPEEIHRIGLSEIERIRGELDRLRREAGFSGDLDAFKQFLKTDRRFFPATPEEIGERLMSAIRRIEPRISAQFGSTPKAPYGVRRLDPELEPAMTFGYYQQPTPARPRGDYLYNGSRLSERSLLNAPALIYHELVPGHHFQINLQKENAALPVFRREDFSENGFVEGWGEYASALAGELGMYADPYDACGRLAMDAFVSARLVVDTGMNALGWSRDRAIAYMKENTFEADLQISTETLRYSADIPAQALAYKLGARKIRELREKARAALGPAFDVRAFHDAVLGSGAIPLSVLEQKIDGFIATRRPAARGGGTPR